MKKLNTLLFAAVLAIVACNKKDTLITPPPPGGGTGTGNNQTGKLIANAGADQTITLPPNTVILDGSRSYDSSGKPMNFAWRQIAGANATISTHLSRTTIAYFRVAGEYQFELKVWNAGGEAFDTTAVTVKLSDYCNVSRTEGTVGASFLSHLPAESYPWQIAATGNKLFIPGGGVTGGDIDISIYDLQNATWTTKTLSDRRWGVGAIAAGDKVFFAGGMQSGPFWDIPSDVIDIYNVSNNSWSRAQLSEARGYVQAAVVGSKVLFAGGQNAYNSLSNKVDIYDLQTNTWSSATLRTARVVHASVTAQNKIMFIGGYTGFVPGPMEDVLGKPTTDIDIYDATTGQWTVTAMQSNRTQFSAVAHREKVYIAGGIGENGFRTYDVEVIDVNSLTRTNMCLSQPTVFYGGQTAAVKNGSIIFFGTGADVMELDMYNPATGVWSVGKKSTAFFSFQQVAMLTVNNEVYVVSSKALYKLDF